MLYCGAYQWSKFFSYPLGKSSFHLFVDLKQAIVSVSGRLSPHNFEKFFISPLQAYSFRCWFSNNSVITFLERCFPSSFVAEVGIFSSICYSNDLSSILSSEGIVMLLFSLIMSNCEGHVLFMLIHLTGVSCFHLSSLILSSIASLSNLSAVWNPSYPLCHSFNTSGGSVLLDFIKYLPIFSSSCSISSIYSRSAVKIISFLLILISFQPEWLQFYLVH